MRQLVCFLDIQFDTLKLLMRSGVAVMVTHTARGREWLRAGSVGQPHASLRTRLASEHLRRQIQSRQHDHLDIVQMAREYASLGLLNSNDAT